MCHLLLAGYEDVPSFLNQLKLKVQPVIVLCKQMTDAEAPSILASQSTEMYVSRRNAFVTIKDTFSGYSCAKKMCHLLLACYEDVPSFLNRLKLNTTLYCSYGITLIITFIILSASRNAKYRKRTEKSLANIDNIVYIPNVNNCELISV